MSLVNLTKIKETLQIKSRLENVRLDSNDFHLNGIESDLDDVDRYIASERRMRITMLSGLGRSYHISQTASTTIEFCQRRKNQHCVFCKNNGETLSVYGDHTLKDDHNRTVCPILRRYVCPKCGQTGDRAHTIKYCPYTELVDAWPNVMRQGCLRMHSCAGVGDGLYTEFCNERPMI